MRFLVGSYAAAGSDGIYLVEMTERNGQLTVVAAAQARNPSFVTVSADGARVYAAIETSDHGGVPGGGAAAFALSADAGLLQSIGSQPACGAGPCHVALSFDERYLITSNYGDGTHSVLPVLADGSLGPAAHVVRNPGVCGPGQSSGHAHSASFDAAVGLWYACDLGLDRIIAYEQDPVSGSLIEAPEAGIRTAPGAGPRHLVFSRAHPVLYALCELDSTVCVATRSRTSPAIMQTIPTLPGEYNGKSSAADIHLSADGRFLYASNRGHDSLGVFAVDASSGRLTAVGHARTGSCPRGFRILRGDILVVANQLSNTVEAYRIGSDGIPQALGLPLPVMSPTCIAAIP